MTTVIILLFLYFIPTGMSEPSRRGSVFVVNLFFGWTMLGWAVALFMAIRSRENARMARAEVQHAK